MDETFGVAKVATGADTTDERATRRIGLCTTAVARPLLRASAADAQIRVYNDQHAPTLRCSPTTCRATAVRSGWDYFNACLGDRGGRS